VLASKSVDELDDETLLSDLTVKQFKELLGTTRTFAGHRRGTIERC
jgi:hypothetical protein